MSAIALVYRIRTAALSLPDLDDDLPGVLHVLTSAHRPYLDLLDPEALDDAALSEFFDDMGYGFEEAPMAARDALELLRDQVVSIGDDEALPVMIV